MLNRILLVVGLFLATCSFTCAQEKRLQAVQSLGELRIINPLNPNTDVLVEGAIVSGDGGGGIYRFYSDDTTATNATTVLTWITQPTLGRWKQITANTGINGDAQSVLNIAALAAIPVTANTKLVYVRSYFNIGDGGEGFFTPTNTVSGTNLGTRIASTTASWSWDRREAQGVREINARWFGIDNTGATNIVVGFTNMMEQYRRTGATLRFPSGDYLCASQIDFNGITNITIKGDGIGITRFRSSFNVSPSTAATWRFANCTNVIFRDFTMGGDGQTDATGAYELITFSPFPGTATIDNIYFLNCEFKHARHAGIRVFSSTVSRNFFVFDCLFKDSANLNQSLAGGGGLEVAAVQNLIVSRCTFDNVGDSSALWSVYAFDCNGGRITGNTFKSGAAIGTGSFSVEGYNVIIANNMSYGNPTNRIRSTSNQAFNLEIENNLFDHARYTFRASTNVTVKGNIFRQWTNSVAHIEILANAYGFLIEGNQFNTDGLESSSSFNARTAIVLYDDEVGGCSNIVIRANTFNEIGGVTVERGTNVVIVGNRIHAPTYLNAGNGAIRLIGTADETTDCYDNDIYIDPAAMALQAQVTGFRRCERNNVISGVIDSSVTNLNILGKYRTAFPPSAVQSLLAGTVLAANATTIQVVGNGGAVTLTATPTIIDGPSGTVVIICGTSDVNTVTLQDQGTLPNSNLELGAATRVLGAGDTLTLRFDTTASVWYEVSFTNN